MADDSSRVRVYIATSLDGFIAGPDDDLSWLPQGDDPGAEREPGFVDFEPFMADVGALLMGRRTHDVVAGFDVPWPYGDRPVLVPTHRPLQPAHETVRPVEGSLEQMVAQAKQAAAGKDVYLDGGALIRQALDAGLVDELIVTLIPVALGAGVPLLAGLERPQPMRITGQGRYGQMLQVTLVPKRS